MYAKLFTSESVGAGHPDKICDQISDTILDRVLTQDKNARVAIEVMASNRLIIVGGELTTTGYVDVVAAAWEVLESVGYHENDFTIISNVNSQSSDINQGVDQADGEIGAGDQGIMFGYAVNETPELMPLPITLAHALAKRAETLRKNGTFKYAHADLKTQVTIDYSGKVPTINSILMSVQHDVDYDQKQFYAYIKNDIMDYVANQYHLNRDFKVYINPIGQFIIGGPIGDTGLTGRKIIIDTYGGKSHHGGGAFSGKDYTKVDRSGAYAARWIAKNIVAAKLADEAEIQLSYAIGISQPISIAIETFGTEKVDHLKIEEAVAKVFDLSPKAIIKELDLKRPIYHKTSVFGHFGRTDEAFTWEKTNRVKQLLQAVK
ncbi:methionine adenosyltransferase [Candidatus Mycoplasma mahonii]|uniref:methionine adenosyltransferase n=1 Tax=Candidatus Mycoplasma mahonii TaxID=3004105 RepID=UPI0026ED7487|nr:methionine adenosyltransferase [Candidatus Mycoplasma mahonii]WKX02408.1 methionine adenosyltransferase [Candidatus Mycoplasma mahonii]